MKKFLICGLIAFSAMAVTLTSCGKYEDGPKLSLLTKKSRVVNTWAVEKYTSTSASGAVTDFTNLFSDYTITFTKDGTYNVTWGSLADNGTWSLSDNKEQLLTTAAAVGSTQDAVTITRLKAKELWTKQTSSSGVIDEVHYKQK